MLSHYLRLFSKLRRDYKHGGAPHKPVLLLAILELVRKGEILHNRIAITPELVLEFKTIWSKLVVTPHIPNFALPFYHLKTEPFWKLVTKGNQVIPTTSSNSIRSLNALKDSVAFAEIDQELFQLMLDPVNRTILEEALLDQYFPATKAQFRTLEYNLFTDLEKQIVSEDAESYREHIETLRKTLSGEAFEEELFVRGGVFKREVPKLYHFQCAISGMRIESLNNAQMVDACHIVPFAISKDDTITNGISLSPNLHRAFDRGLLTITADYTVLISKSVKENQSPYSLKQFEGKPIILPENHQHHPSVENLKWHQRECFVA